MTHVIRRLAPGDEALLTVLAVEAADLGMSDNDEGLEPLSESAMRAYLANPAVLHWVALDGDQVIGTLYCLQVPLPTGEGLELLLYEVGVRAAWRRQGVGHTLIQYLEAWMQAHAIDTVWVLADGDGAREFYEACRFKASDPQPVYMLRSWAAET